MSVLYVTSGIQGSGKTTLAKYLANENNAIVFSYDDYVDKDNVFDIISNYLANGENVVFDSLNLTKAHRISLLTSIKIPCEKILYVTTTPLRECLERNNKRDDTTRVPEPVLMQCYNMFQPPAMDEGWDEIYYCYEK